MVPKCASDEVWIILNEYSSWLSRMCEARHLIILLLAERGGWRHERLNKQIYFNLENEQQTENLPHGYDSHSQHFIA